MPFTTKYPSCLQTKGRLPTIIACLTMALLSPHTGMAASIDTPKFHQALYELHLQTIKGKQLRLVEKEGQYQGSAAGKYRFKDTQYFDASNNHLLSHVIRDGENPDAIHIVEVNIYDESGRIVRDFGSITLPNQPTRPIRTFINFHQYNKELHSFRQYDVDGEITYESCKGKLESRTVNISLDGLDIKPATTSSVEYKTCFDGIKTDWANYAVPH